MTPYDDVPAPKLRRTHRLNLRVLQRDHTRQVRRGLLPIIEDYPRPRTRAECPVTRPCPYVACKHNLYLDVMPNGTLLLIHPKEPVESMTESCALDVAARGGITLEEIGTLLNFTRERIRQIVDGALVKIRLVAKRDEFEDPV